MNIKCNFDELKKIILSNGGTYDEETKTFELRKKELDETKFRPVKGVTFQHLIGDFKLNINKFEDFDTLAEYFDKLYSYLQDNYNHEDFVRSLTVALKIFGKKKRKLESCKK